MWIIKDGDSNGNLHTHAPAPGDDTTAPPLELLGVGGSQ
ncbi:hypothetical protein RSAG8_06670, partial [Rhizoctonia solani AG-8 WAC10335]